MFNSDPLPKRFLKYSILLTIKESYLFIRNTLGLMLHPFKTLRSLFREQDFSQIVLVISFPIISLIIGLGTIWAARRLVGATPGDWRLLTKSGVSLTFLISCFLFFYLGYWLFQLWKIKRKT